MVEVQEVVSTGRYSEPESTLKRDRTHISADILRACLSGTKKTHIVYQTNINFKVLKTYLQRLTSAGLLEQVRNLYYTTDAGRNYIYHVEELVI